MGTKYTTQATSGYNSSPPPDDGTQVAANLISWSMVKTKLADVLKTFGEAINTALVSALDLSARAIASNDTAIASDHWKTLQVTGATTIQLSSAASMGAGYEVGVMNAGAGVVTVTPAGSDTINLVSASVTVPIKGTIIFRTNQALTGYNIVAQSNSIQNPLNQSLSWGTGVANFGTIAKRKTADESVTNAGTGTTLQDDDHLTFSIAANEEWIATLDIDAGNALGASTGVKVAITTPAGATLNVTASLITDVNAAGSSGRTTVSGTGIVLASGGAGLSGAIHMAVWVLNGANAGSITLQWAQGSASATALTFRKGSFLQATRIA